jgi:hypothetical protein
MRATFHEVETVEIPEWATERAHRGAAWLDSKFGPSWDQKINLDRLEIGSPINCIVGQLMRHGHLSLLFINAGEGVEYGFSLGHWDALALFLPIPPVRRPYRPLNDAWKALLRERCEAREVSASQTAVATAIDTICSTRLARWRVAGPKQAPSTADASRHTSA